MRSHNFIPFRMGELQRTTLTSNRSIVLQKGTNAADWDKIFTWGKQWIYHFSVLILDLILFFWVILQPQIMKLSATITEQNMMACAI